MSCEVYKKVRSKLPEELRTLIEENYAPGTASGYVECEKACYWTPQIIPIFIGEWEIKASRMEELNVSAKELVEYLCQFNNIYVCHKNESEYRYYEAEKICTHYAGLWNVKYKYGIYVPPGKIFFVKFE